MSQTDPPASLVALQAAFGEAIATPLAIDDDAEALIQVDRYPPLALRAVAPHGGKSAPERLATYNKQYWFRLLTVMQEEYPLLCAMLGVTPFNQLVTDYLDRYPSRSQTLRNLSDDLGQFLAETPRWGSPERRQAARLERLCIEAFDAAQRPPLDPAALSPEAAAGLLTSPLELQPHWALFAEDWDLLAWRRRVKDAPDEPPTIALEARPAWWAVYRRGRVQFEPLTDTQHALLERLAAGAALQEACDSLAETLSSEALTEVGAGIQHWFARWVSLGWFVAAEPD